MADNTQSVAVIARLLDLSERRVRQLSAQGVIPKAARGRYELVGAVRGYVQYLRRQIMKEEAGEADYGAGRTRLIKARADLAEMEAAQLKAELLPATDVASAWTAIMSLLRTRLLGLPDSLAPLLHETTSITEARNILKKAIDEVLAELAATPVTTAPASGTPGDRGGGEDGAGGAGAAPGTDDRGVGGP